jgi:hypothetical protein
LGRYEISGTEDSIATSLSMTQEFCIELILLSPLGRGFEFEFKETELNGIEFKCMLREENFLDRDDTTIFGKARFFLGKRARHISHGDEGRIKNKNKFLAGLLLPERGRKSNLLRSSTFLLPGNQSPLTLFLQFPFSKL